MPGRTRARRWLRREQAAWVAWVLAVAGGVFVVFGLLNLGGWTETNALGLVALGTVVAYVSLSGQRLGSLKALGVEVVFEKAVEAGADPQKLVAAIEDDARVPDDVKAGVAMLWRERRDRAVRHQRDVGKALEKVAGSHGWTVETVLGARRTHDFVVTSGARSVLVDARWSADEPDQQRVRRWVDDVGAPNDTVLVVTSGGTGTEVKKGREAVPLRDTSGIEKLLVGALTAPATTAGPAQP